MDDNRKQLMKYFSTVLKNLASGKETDNLMTKNLAFYFTRKELIEMIKKRFNGSIPKEHNLVELEKKELLALIGNKLYIIAYVTEKWSQELEIKEVKPEKPKADGKQTEKVSKQTKSN